MRPPAKPVQVPFTFIITLPVIVSDAFEPRTACRPVPRYFPLKNELADRLGAVEDAAPMITDPSGFVARVSLIYATAYPSPFVVVANMASPFSEPDTE